MDKNESAKVRRRQLAKWFETRSIPENEKSYISQLINGKASFGEKAARRIERDYGMGEGYLDGKEVIDNSTAELTKIYNSLDDNMKKLMLEQMRVFAKMNKH